MSEFVKLGGIESRGARERRERRHSDQVKRWNEAGLVAVFHHLCAGGRDEVINQPIAAVAMSNRGSGWRGNVRRQIVALLNVEDRERLQHADVPHRPFIDLGLVLAVLGESQILDEINLSAVLALADVPAKLERLLKGKEI